jgi:threonine dehydrogenase-like Zn-dependent dehydrogenase
MNSEMTGVLFEGEGRFSISNIPVPRIRDDNDVLIKLEAASICGSDIQILKIPPGHPAKTGIVLGCGESGGIR